LLLQSVFSFDVSLWFSQNNLNDAQLSSQLHSGEELLHLALIDSISLKITA